MSEKRRDKRNRILREGEYQRADGRYRYRYIDEDGKEKWVYSWRLDKNDPTPRGKKQELSLREKEKQIQADLFDHIVTHGGDYSVIELVEKYISLKTGVNHNTRAGYKTVINILKKDPFGKLLIDKVRLSDAKAWLIKLQQVDGKVYRIQMPKVTPHVCRHTFCSNMAKSGMNPKTLQYVMGHAGISVTLNVYTHVQFDDAQAEMLRLAKA